jgi:hypothetical protein
MPTTSKNLRALNAVMARLTAGLPATSPSYKVLLCKRAIDVDDLKAVVVFEGDEAAESTQEGAPADGRTRSIKVRLDVNIEAHVPATHATAGAALATAKADIKKAVLKYEEQTLKDADGDIGPIAYLGSTALPKPDGANSEAVLLRFQVAYAEGFGDPFNTR